MLGERLKQCTRLALATRRDKTAHDIFGSPDDLKLRSCMTLFDAVAPDEPVLCSAVCGNRSSAIAGPEDIVKRAFRRSRLVPGKAG